MSFRFALVLWLAAVTFAAEEPAKTKAESPEGMVLVAAGEFTMGRTRLTPDDSTGMRPLILRDDRPPHEVRLDAYFIDTHEVTHAEYAEFVKVTGRHSPYHWVDGEMPPGRAEYPIYNVDWSDAKAYCEWTGKRLPTEAEWERAARGGLEGKDYPWGDEEPTEDKALYNTSEGPGPVGSYDPNGLGIYDMAGSVAEWCSDWFERSYYEHSPPKNPQGPEEGLYKVIRGGAWSDGPERITVFFRNWVRPNQTTPNIGFRCVQDAGKR